MLYEVITLGTTASDSKFNLSVPNIGYVVNFPSSPNRTSSLVSVSLGLGYNRMNNFNMQKIITGSGATSSMLDGLAIRADNNDYNDYVDLATQTNLVYNYDWDSNHYQDMLINNPREEADLDNPDFNPNNMENFRHDQRRTVSQRGSLDEYTISFAANFNHKVYLGATVGIQDLYYKRNNFV